MRKISSRRVLLAVFLVTAFVATAAAAEPLDRAAEVARHRQALDDAKVTARIDNLKILSRSGIADEALFDEIERRLLERYTSRNEEPLELDETAWLAEALGLSGLEKYRATLNKVAAGAPLEKVGKHAREAAADLEIAAKRNAAIARRYPEAQGLALEHELLYNRLRSDDRKLRKDAAKMICRSSPQAPLLYETMAERLRAGYASERDEQAVDELAWYCKALAVSGLPEHRDLVKKVAKGAGEEKLQEVAQEIVEQKR